MLCLSLLSLSFFFSFHCLSLVFFCLAVGKLLVSAVAPLSVGINQMRSKIAVCWLCVCLFAQLGAAFDHLPLVPCPPWGARPPSTLTQPFLLQLLVMSTATPFVSLCIWLSSAVYSRFTGTLPPCLCVSPYLFTLCCLSVFGATCWFFNSSGYDVFPSLLGLFCISL